MFWELRRPTVCGEEVVGKRGDETTHGNNISKDAPPESESLEVVGVPLIRFRGFEPMTQGNII